MKSIENNFFYRFIKQLILRIQADNISAYSAQLAYYLILSLFPFLIFLLNLLSFTNLGQQAVLNQLFESLPHETSSILQPIILGIVQSSSTTLLSLSLLLSLWSGSNGVKNIMIAMDSAFRVKEKRHPLMMRGLSLLFTVALAFIIILTLLTQVFGTQLFYLITDRFGEFRFLENLFHILKFLIPTIVMALSFTMLYKFGPYYGKRNKLSFKHALIGGVTATLGWLVINTIFAFYVDNFGNFSTAYGSLAGIIVLLIWLFLTSLMILFGGEVSAILYHSQTEESTTNRSE